MVVFSYGHLLVVGGILIKTLIRMFTRKVSSIIGVLVTLVLLIWGLTVYGKGNAMSFFRITLSQPVFILICIGFFAYDVYWIYSAFFIERSSKTFDWSKMP